MAGAGAGPAIGAAVVLGVGTASVLVAGVWGSPAILAFGVTLLVGLVAARVTVGRAVRRIRPARIVSPVELSEDRPITMRIDLGDVGGRFLQADVLDPDGRWRALDGPHGTVSLRIGHRGTFVLQPTLVRLRDAYGLVTRRVLVGDPVSVVVVPATPTVATLAGRFGGQEEEPDELRPLTVGTPLSRVHWRSSARRGELYEQHYAPAPATMPVVALDTAGADDAQIDRAAREVAGYLARQLDVGGSRLLLPGAPGGQIVTDRASLDDALRRLAVLGPDPRPAAVSRATVRVRAARPGPEAPPRPPLPIGVRPA
ncbi:MAG: DUF58 domain-containing protein [Solirubrobacteraceae bacterium]